MTTDAPGHDHPDVNALADLAADVLPVEEARVVEAHVIGCPDCADLLADAERIRPLLLADEVGPMPAAVWDRLSGVLAQEATARAAHGEPRVRMSPTPAPETTPWQAPWEAPAAAAPNGGNGASPHPGDLPSRRSRRGRRAAGDDARPDPLAWTDEPGPAGRRPDDGDPGRGNWVAESERSPISRHDQINPVNPVSQVSHGGQGSPVSRLGKGDQDARSSEGSDTGLTRVIRPLDDLTPTSSPAERSTETTSSLPALGGSRVSGLRRTGRSGGPSRRDVRDSDREENKVVDRLKAVRLGRRGTLIAVAAGVVVSAGLGGLVWSLVSGSGSTGDATAGRAPVVAATAPVLKTDKNYGGSDTAFADQARALAKQASAPDAKASLAASAKGAEPLADPAVLGRCLDALDAADQRPVAVDLARFQNRESAIIVLQGDDGTLEAWAVSRDCGSGDEVPLKFVVVPKA